MSDQSMEMNIGFQPGMISPGCPNGQFYTVKSGDTMFFIAKRYSISLQDLINANPQIPDPNTIYPGQTICIPLGQSSAPCPDNQVYRVVSGDTMFEIARRFGISLDALITANPQIADPNLIFPGQEICIPMAPVAAPAPMPMPIVIPPPPSCLNGSLYTVVSGDTLFDIARANNILLADLIAANPQILDPNLIYPGQVICIPVPAASAPALPVPAPCPMPAPPQATPVRQPAPMPCPMPAPSQPLPIPCPVSPIEQPAPLPGVPTVPGPALPCPPGQGMMYPMPVYIVVPWDECPHRPKKRRHGRRSRCR